MTNEEMAVAIQDGKTKFYADLWENTKNFLFAYGFKMYRDKMERIFQSCGINKEDSKKQDSDVILDFNTNSLIAHMLFECVSISYIVNSKESESTK